MHQQYVTLLLNGTLFHSDQWSQNQSVTTLFISFHSVSIAGAKPNGISKT